MAAPPEFDRFVAVQFPRVVGALDLVLGGEHAVAEELAQEAFLRASARWERVSQMESPGGWVAHVALNLARSQLRRRLAERRANARVGPMPDVPPPGGEDETVVRQAVAALPKQQREIVVLRYLLGLTSAEVADRLGMRPEAVRKASSRALAALREELGGVLEGEVSHG